MMNRKIRINMSDYEEQIRINMSDYEEQKDIRIYE